MKASVPLHRLPRQRGFTLIELITVIIVMGILAAVVTMGGTPLTASRRINTDALKSTIRYAQSRAMKTGTPWGVAWNGTSYWVFNGGDAASTNAQPLPGEQTNIVNYSNRNVSLAPGAAVIAFNAVGQPFTDAAATTTALPADLAVTMTATDDNAVSDTFTIITETGYLDD